MQFTVPSFYLDLLNQVFELEKKLDDQLDNRSLARPLERMKQLFVEEFPMTAGEQGVGLVVHNPLGEKYTETRTDCDASIAGAGEGKLRIIEVIKPIIYLRGPDLNQIIQRGVVIVAAD
ncbi:MAG: hypothetical protein AAF840_05820 [Bacteroidota bacterium]